MHTNYPPHVKPSSPSAAMRGHLCTHIRRALGNTPLDHHPEGCLKIENGLCCAPTDPQWLESRSTHATPQPPHTTIAPPHCSAAVEADTTHGCEQKTLSPITSTVISTIHCVSHAKARNYRHPGVEMIDFFLFFSSCQRGLVLVTTAR